MSSSGALSNIAWLASEKILKIFLAVFVTAIVARALGPAGYGELSLIISLGFFVQIVSQFGLERVLATRLCKDRNNHPVLLTTSLVLRLLLSVASVLVVLIWTYFNNNSFIQQKVFFGLLILLPSTMLMSFEVCDYWFQSKVQSKYSVYAKTVAAISSATLKIIFVYFGSSVEMFVFAFSFENIFGVFLLFFIARKNGFPNFCKVRISELLNIFRSAAPFGFSAIGVYAYTRVDQILIAEQLGQSALGNYAMAMPFSSQTFSFIPMVICTTALPIISMQVERDRKESIFAAVLVIILSVCLPTVLFVFFSSDILIKLLVGNEFSHSADVLKIHIFSFIFSAIGMSQSYWIASTGSGGILIWKTVLTAVISVGLNLAFLSAGGVLVAAWVAVISELFGVLFITIARWADLKPCLRKALEISPISAIRYLKKG